MPTRHCLSLLLATAFLIGCNEQPEFTAEPNVQPSFANSNNASCDRSVNSTIDRLLECVTIDRVRVHQAALQAIADANNGIRASGTPGYNQSAEYIAGQLQAAGYTVTIQPFAFLAFVNLSPSVLAQVSPAPAGPIVHAIMSYSGTGDVTASVSPVINLGCNAADFAGFPVGNIALIMRGECFFAVKAINAFNAGASGVVIYNNIPGGLNASLGGEFDLDISVVSVSQSIGQQLAATAGLVLQLKTETLRGIAGTANIFAETNDGDPNNVVMVGAHLDGVSTGPGINDNGSASAAILETALQMARVKPRNKVRFAWWAAEEVGLLGSTNYVNSLSTTELNKIALYLNFDMIGSPNHVFFVYDGDASDRGGANPYPPGSGAIEQVFESFYTGRGQPYQGVDINGASDHTPFINAGIPSGGLFTGATGIKSDEQAAIWGGAAGNQFDPCYHLSCDTYDNVNLFALDMNADAVAFATMTFAMNTSLVNGIKGKGNFKSKGSAASSFAQGAVK